MHVTPRLAQGPSTSFPVVPPISPLWHFLSSWFSLSNFLFVFPFSVSLNFCLSFSFSLSPSFCFSASFSVPLFLFFPSPFSLSVFLSPFLPPSPVSLGPPRRPPRLPAASPCPDASTLCPWSDPDVRQGLAGGHGQLPGRQREGTPSQSPLGWRPAQPCSSQLGASVFLAWPQLAGEWPALDDPQACEPRAAGHSPLPPLHPDPTRPSSCLVSEGRRYRQGTRPGAKF